MSYPSAFRLLSLLSKGQLKDLKEYLSQRLLSKRKEVTDLYNAWSTRLSNQEKAEQIYSRAYPKKAFRSRDWHLSLSRLQDATESFLAWQQFTIDEFSQHLFSLRGLRKLRSTVFFDRRYRQAKKIRGKRPRQEATLLLWDYQMELEFYDYRASTNRRERTNLQAVSDNLDHFFIAEKLRLACLAQSRFLANQEAYDLRYLPTILTDLEEKPNLLEVPAIRLYATCYRAVIAESQLSDFQALRDTMDTFRHQFPKREMRDVYLLAINYCIRQLNTGKTEFLPIIKQLYQESLQEDYLLEDGQLPESTFTNMIALHLKLGDYDNSVRIMASHAKDLPPATRDSILNFNRARWHHAQQQYDQALPLLVQVDTSAPYLYLGAKSLQLRIFYEQGSETACESVIQQLRQYLRRRKDLGYRQENYRLLVRFFKQLLQLDPMSQEDNLALLEQVKAAPAFAEQSWFLEQVSRRL